MEKFRDHLRKIENNSVFHESFIQKLESSIREGSVESIVANILYTYTISDIEKALTVILEYIKENK